MHYERETDGEDTTQQGRRCAVPTVSFGFVQIFQERADGCWAVFMVVLASMAAVWVWSSGTFRQPQQLSARFAWGMHRARQVLS